MKANHTYLSDGAKASVLNASEAGYDYNGSFTYSHSANGSRTLESVAFSGGRIRRSGSSYTVNYYVTDHLGSVRAIVNASGSVVEQNDYYPFGARHANGLSTLSGNRWRFSGKEGYDSAFGIAYDDFGARLYDRTAWTAIDPLAEKYYGISPYSYCAGNPVRFVDLDGKSWYFNAENGSFVSHIDDGDDKVYMISQAQVDEANGNIMKLHALRSDSNMFGNRMLEDDLPDSAILGVYQYMYNQANSIYEGSLEHYLESDPNITIVKSTNRLLPVIATGSVSNNIKIYRSSYGHYYNGYEIINILSHEIKHRIDINNHIEPDEVTADIFSKKHWSYDRVSKSRRDAIEQHIKENSK